MLKVILVGGAVVAVMGYAWSQREGANEYPMAPKAAYDKLMAAEFEKGGKQAWGTVGAEKSGNGSNRITFTGWGECTLDIVPDGDEATRSALSVTCPNMGEGAAAGMETALRRHSLIEWIDSTMTNRPYDQQLAFMGTTAGRWPDDVVAHGGIIEAQAEAIKMSSEAARADQGESSDSEPDRAGLNYRSSSGSSTSGSGNGAGVDQSRSFGAEPSRY